MSLSQMMVRSYPGRNENKSQFPSLIYSFPYGDGKPPTKV